MSAVFENIHFDQHRQSGPLRLSFDLLTGIVVVMMVSIIVGGIVLLNVVR